MTWTNILAIVIVVVLLANSAYVVLWQRRKRGDVLAKHRPLIVTRIGLAVMSITVIALLVGIVFQTNAILRTTTDLGEFIQTHGMLTYWVLCTGAGTLVEVAVVLLGRRLFRRRDAV
jgi:uncharacterized membrane protein